MVSGTLLNVLSSYFPRFMISTAVGPFLLKPRQWLGVPQNPTKGTCLLYAVHIAICLLLALIFGKVTPARFLCSKKRRHSCAMDTFRPCPLRCTCFSQINSSMSRAASSSSVGSTCSPPPERRFSTSLSRPLMCCFRCKWLCHLRKSWKYSSGLLDSCCCTGRGFSCAWHAYPSCWSASFSFAMVQRHKDGPMLAGSIPRKRSMKSWAKRSVQCPASAGVQSVRS